MSQTKAQLIDNLVQPITGAAGSASAPTFSFTADPNTGIYSPGADQIAVATNGTGRLFVDASGRVGIGTTPGRTLDVNGSIRTGGSANPFLALNDGSNESYLEVNSGNTRLTAGANNLTFFTGVNERMRITSAGLVGIGTSSPGDLVTISDSTTPKLGLRTGTTQRGEFRATSAITSLVSYNSSPLSFIINDGTDKTAIYIDSSQRVGIGTTSPAGPCEIYYGGNDSGLYITSEDGVSWGYSPNIFFRTELTDGGGVGTSGRIRSVYESSNNFGMSFHTTSAGSNSERLRITSAGNVGIGTTSGFVAPLHVSNGGAAGLEFYPATYEIQAYNRSTSAYGLARYNAAGHQFAVSASEAARIDASGRLLVGTSSSSQSAKLTVQGNANDNDEAFLDLNRGTDPATNQNLAVIRFTQVGSREGARISALRDGGVWGAASCPARLVFSTTANGASAPTERARINSDGMFQIGATNFAKSSSGGLAVSSTIGTGQGVGNSGSLAYFNETNSGNAAGLWIGAYTDQTTGVIGSTTATGNIAFQTYYGFWGERMRIRNDGRLLQIATGTDSHYTFTTAGASTSNAFYVGHHSASGYSGTASYIVYTNGNVVNTNNSYGSLSDAKLKENIVDANSQWDDLKALQVRNYNFKEGQTHTQIGLVAQEVELVSPGLVSESPDRDEEGNDLGTVTKGVNYSVLYMKAVKALQEAMERIETLEGMVAVNNITIDEQQHQLSTLAARLTALESA